MAVLVQFDAQGQWGETLVCEDRVVQTLRQHGLDHGRWPLRPLDDASLGAVRAAYAKELGGVGDALPLPLLLGVERIQLRPRQSGWRALRAAFNAEQVQSFAEIRHILEGTGLFYFRVPDGHLALFCEAQDWVAIPAGMAWSFDAGLRPDVHLLRLLGTAASVPAQPTHASRPGLPPLDDFVEELLALTGHDEY